MAKWYESQVNGLLHILYFIRHLVGRMNVVFRSSVLGGAREKVSISPYVRVKLLNRNHKMAVVTGFIHAGGWIYITANG